MHGLLNLVAISQNGYVARLFYRLCFPPGKILVEPRRTRPWSRLRRLSYNGVDLTRGLQRGLLIPPVPKSALVYIRYVKLHVATISPKKTAFNISAPLGETSSFTLISDISEMEIVFHDSKCDNLLKGGFHNTGQRALRASQKSGNGKVVTLLSSPTYASGLIEFFLHQWFRNECQLPRWLISSTYLYLSLTIFYNLV